MRVLTARERQKLKARAHALEPAVQVGQHGMTEQLAKELDRALTGLGPKRRSSSARRPCYNE